MAGVLSLLQRDLRDVRIYLSKHPFFTCDFDGYEEQIKKLAAEHLESVEMADNRISGTITVSENKLMCISLPHSPGWRAYVDGKEVEILKTDLAFMGLELEAGTHTVELRYFTPYFAFGILLSVIGWSIFVIWIALDFYKRKKQKGQ